jgi:hypothetical protein
LYLCVGRCVKGDLGVFFFFFAFSRVQTGSAFFVSLSISFGFGYKFYDWMPFTINLYYLFSKGNSSWYTPCLKSPSQTKLVYSLLKNVAGVYWT